MNLLEILRSRVDSLTVGEHTIGLRAVVQHIQVAMSHLDRGNRTGDDTAFTDAIYRTNQAFEGSLKEAYRVLASKDPQKVRPYDIENFFQDKATLRPRVLSQFTRYRQEWRNPATHDYRLDFDEDEALLAIVSVAAFAVVLVDQMSETLNYEKARAAVTPVAHTDESTLSLAERVADALMMFQFEAGPHAAAGPPREAEIVGALWGYLAGALPGLQVASETLLAPNTRMRADILATLGDEHVIIEVKRYRPDRDQLTAVLQQVGRYLAVSESAEAVVYIHDDANNAIRVRQTYQLPDSKQNVIVVGGPSLPSPA